MRPIKFRSWVPSDDCFYYSHLEEDNGEGPVIWVIDENGPHVKVLALIDREAGGEHVQEVRYVMPEQAVGQFSTEQDANKMDIYVGDRVMAEDVETGVNTGVVKFGRYCINQTREPVQLGFYIEWDALKWRQDLGYWVDYEELTVIGNIHEEGGQNV